MTPSDKPAFLGLVTDVLGFYRQPTSPFGMGVWWEACRGMELDAIRAAMTAHATDPQRGHFPPMPADVIRLVQGSVADRASEAWTELLRQVRAIGSYGRPALGLTERTALDAIGGWATLCASDEDQLPWVQRRFVEAYQAAVAREQRDAIAGPNTAPLRLA